LNSDRDRIDYIQEDIEEAWDEAHILETDKAWDAIHRCLTDGKLTIGSATTPLGKLILGGTQLYSDTDEYIVNLIEHGELSEISAALKTVTKDWMNARYLQLKSTDYPAEGISEDDFQYTWEWFSGIPDFIARADNEGRAVIFTVDQ
jgi:hypothetical protein